jgi:cytoskeletal protein RodZ
MSIRFMPNAWFVVAFASACSGTVGEPVPVPEVTPSSSEMTGAPVPAAPATAVQPSAPEQQAVTPVPASSAPPVPAPSAPPVPAPSAAQAATPNPTPVPAPSTETPASGFDAGSGMMQADGTTVVYHIPDGTGGGDWNPMSMPIRVRRGMTIRFVDDDTTKDHQLHTSGQPCSHGFAPIGEGFDCAIRDNAPLGLVNGVYDHNGAGGRGRVYIEVVE